MLNYVTSASPAELARRNTQTGTNQVKTDYTYTPDWMFENSNAGSVGDNIQVGASKTAAVQTETSSEVNTPAESGSKWSDKCDDGKDDGKIGIGSAILHTLKGAGKSIVNTVVGIVTDPKKLLLTAGTVVACVLCPPLAVGLGVAGVAGGLYSGAKAVGQAVDLYKNGGTDAEAKAAFEDIGASALQVGVSALGVKAGVKAMKATSGSAMSNVAKSSKTGVKGVIENGRNTVKAFAEDTVTGGRGFTRVNGRLKINTSNAGYKGTQIYTNVKNNIKNEGIIKGTQTSASQARTKISEARTAKTAQKEYNRYKNADAETQAKMDADIKNYKTVNEAQNSLKSAEGKVNKLNEQLTNVADDAAKQGIQKQLKTARGELRTAQQDLVNAKYKQAFENAKTEIPKLEQTKVNAKQALDDAKKAYNTASKSGNGAEAELITLKNAKADYAIARDAANSTSSNFITRSAANHSKFARSADYTSFGALTAPIGNELKNANQISNYDIAHYNAQLMSSNANGYPSGNYTYSNVWENNGLRTTGMYSYNTNYEEVANQTGAIIRQQIL